MKRILVIAPHADDEFIGVGGTIIKEIENGNEVYVCIVTKGMPPLFTEAVANNIQSEAKKCHAEAKIKKTYFLDFPAVMLEEQHRYIVNDKILEVIEEVKPDEVYIPHFGDMQKDHQIVADACMVTLRPKYSFSPKRIYAYETLSETGWNVPSASNAFIPNRFVDISEQLDEKIRCMGFYKSQLYSFPNARSIEAIIHLAKYRGSLMNIHAAEAFMVIREID